MHCLEQAAQALAGGTAHLQRQGYDAVDGDVGRPVRLANTATPGFRRQQADSVQQKTLCGHAGTEGAVDAASGG